MPDIVDYLYCYGLHYQRKGVQKSEPLWNFDFAKWARFKEFV
jgi:hypothetical protein